MSSRPAGGAPAPIGAHALSGMGKKQFTLVMLGMLARLALGILVILIMLALVPKTPDDSVLSPIALAIFAIAVYVWFFTRQVKGVYHSRYPTLRAVESLILVAAMFLAIFTMIYVTMSVNAPGSFTEQLDSFTGYYFSLTVLATVGFGDITPVTTMARGTTMVQMALDIAFLAVVIKVISGAARKALEDRGKSGTGGVVTPPSD